MGGESCSITGHMKYALSLGGCKIKWIYLKILPLSSYEEEWLLSTYCLMWCTVNWVMKILMRT